jgi:hypothetical protein
MTKICQRFFEIVTREKDKLAKQYGVQRNYDLYNNLKK